MAVPSAVLLHGDETFLVEQEAARTLEAWRSELVSDFGYEALDPVGITPSRLRDALLQAPFLDPFRVVAARGIQANRADVLAAGLLEVPETTRLLLAATGRRRLQSGSLTGAEGGKPDDDRLPDRAPSLARAGSARPR